MNRSKKTIRQEITVSLTGRIRKERKERIREARVTGYDEE